MKKSATTGQFTKRLLEKYKRAAAITTRKDLERALKQSNERFEIIARVTSDAIYDFDLTTGVLVWSNALQTHYGYDKSEKSDTIEWWTSHIHPDDAMKFEASLNDLVESEVETSESEYRFRKGDGSYAHVRDRLFVQRDEHGEPVRLIGSLLDITKQKQLEQAKDEFISIVSHQLRTPLTSIRLFNEMLADGRLGELTPTQKEYAEKSASSALRMIELVGNILNISRVELGELHINPVPTDIDALIIAYIDELKPMTDAQKIKITYKPSGLTDVPIDSTLFGQIVHNLLTNAIRYSLPRKGKVTVMFTKDEAGYLLTVRDNGIGIPVSVQNHIFERFYRTPNAVRTESEGSGLGLYLIKLITECSGGKVWFESKEAKGTKFYIRLPLTGMQANHYSK